MLFNENSFEFHHLFSSMPCFPNASHSPTQAHQMYVLSPARLHFILRSDIRRNGNGTFLCLAWTCLNVSRTEIVEPMKHCWYLQVSDWNPGNINDLCLILSHSTAQNVIIADIRLIRTQYEMPRSIVSCKHCLSNKEYRHSPTLKPHCIFSVAEI